LLIFFSKDFFITNNRQSNYIHKTQSIAKKDNSLYL
jgi:hypothetical protein